MVEIGMPSADDDKGWAARILPWEFLLAEATRKQRDGRPLTVVRHLSSSRANAPGATPKLALVVENGAGPMRRRVHLPGRSGDGCNRRSRSKPTISSIRPHGNSPTVCSN